MIKILMNLIEATSGTAEILEMDCAVTLQKNWRRLDNVSEDQELPAKLTVAEYLNDIGSFGATWDKQLEAETLKQSSPAAGSAHSRSVTWHAPKAWP